MDEVKTIGQEIDEALEYSELMAKDPIAFFRTLGIIEESREDD